MADDHKKPDPEAEAKKFAFFVFMMVVILLTIWYFSGGPERSDLRGIFLKPLPPVGSGESYGPTIAPKKTDNN